MCDITTHPALQALQQLPGMDINSNMSFGWILQGPAESFVQFLDRLHATLSWQVSNKEARVILLQQLAFTNVNKIVEKHCSLFITHILVI